MLGTPPYLFGWPFYRGSLQAKQMKKMEDARTRPENVVIVQVKNTGLTMDERCL